ncbi:hypothetical protein GGS21DRAFT_102653 [Xylaria nigripes]|nr:hypothetical protein GGS21DRAFT_102653 [Xylaria nigripes]
MDPDLAHDRGPSSTPQNALGREFGVRYPQSTESGSTDSWDDGDFWRSKQTVEDGYSTRSPDRIYDNQFQAESSLVQPQKPRGHPEPRTRHGLASLEAITQDSEGLQEWGQLARKPAVEKKFDDTDFWNALQSNASISQPPLADNRTTEPISPDPWAVSSTHRTPTTHSLGSIPEDKLGDFPVDSRVTESTSPDPKASIKTDDVPLSQKFKHYDFESENYSRHATRSRDDDYKHHRNRPEKFSEPEERFTSRRSGKSSRHSSRFMDDDGQDDYDRYMEKRRQKEQRKAQREAKRTEPIPILLPELISITALANALKVKPEDFLVQLEELGFERVTLDSLMSGETAALVAQEYGYEPTVDSGESQDLKPRPPSDQPWTLPSRPPVVTIMGHVDHGKTTILDYLRKSSVAAQEHGGITQHIGAFSVKLSSGKKITFLDTPGHAAFLTMRQRGANVTDIVVLVVAADDGIMPQTLEALKHARAAKVPIIVAINKIDADGAKIDAVKAALAKVGVDIEDFGGDVQVVCVSGKTGQGMDDLEENILALSEILDHRAEVDGPAEGWILESSLKVSGKVATILIKRGTLRPGDHIAAGLTWAKIRQLRNEAGVNIAEAPPGTPVEIFGWKDLPAAGDQVIQAPDENKAKIAVTYRQSIRGREKDAAEYENIAEARKAQQEKRAREKAANGDAVDLPEALPDKEGVAKIVNFVVKGDVHGSVEAVCAAIQEIGNHEVRPRILRSATGPITEFDVEHAATSKSIVINFSMKTPGHVSRMAESQGVRIFDHNVIYGVIDDVKAVLSEHLAPTITTHVVGDAEVLEIFPINTHGRVYKNVAGCRVRNGLVAKKHMFRVIRNGNTIFDGKLETLKHGKNDIMEIRKGSECGIGFEDFQDFAVGDQLQAYEINSTERKL